MNTLRRLLVGCLAGIASLAFAADDTSKSATRVGPPEGKLLVVGGGNMGPLWQTFLDLAGGKDAPIVVIPTANETVEAIDKAVAALRAQGATNVTQLHTRDPKLADTEAFTAPLRTARAVWLTGGRQWRLVDAYLGTRTQKEILAVLARGGVVGGTSAGASIQASYLVRGAPSGNRIMMSPGHEEGFALLRDTAIDQHVNTRERANDLLPVLKKHSTLLGIALDEATAIIVAGDHCKVAGPGKVRFFAGPEAPVVELTAGASYDLAVRKALP